MNLNQVTIPVKNVKESVEFYKKIGLKLIVASNLNHYARFECPKGDSTFSIHKTENSNINSEFCVYFELDDLETVVNDLTEKGIVFDEQPTEKPWLWKEARLKDPSGNQIILYKAGKNRKNPPWRIK